MARDSKGRFKKGHRKGKRRGFGSIISIRRGMGALPGGVMGQAIIPGVVGASVTAAVALAIRWFVDPAAGNTQRMLVRWAWLFGHAAGLVASLGLLMIGGTPAATSSFVAATGVGLGLFGSDYLYQSKGGAILASMASSDAGASDTSAAAGGGTSGIGRRRGTGAIVPEYSQRQLPSGVGAIVMENVGPSGRRAGTIGSYGETVTLQGINPGAFGTPGFHA